MITYIGKKIIYYLMNGPLFYSTTNKIKQEKKIRTFLKSGLKEIKRIRGKNPKSKKNKSEE